jgi:DNA repair protein RecN (Recombination protein N)
MLSSLRIKNFAIVDNLEIEFGKGLNVITGETGAGKSIILKSIELLGGKRSSADIVRTGQDKAEIEGLFHISSKDLSGLANLNEQLAEQITDEELLIKRVVDSGGRSKVYINGSLVTLSMLESISSALFDITAQHHQQSLLDADYHLKMLDEFGTPRALLDNAQSTYSEYAKQKRLLEQFTSEAQVKRDYFERLAFERDELKQAALVLDEKESIESQLDLLENSEELTKTISEALLLIDDDTNGVEPKLRKITSLLEQSNRLDPALSDVFSLAESSFLQVQEISSNLNIYSSRLNLDPDELERLRARLNEIARLERKYKLPINQLIAHFERIDQEISQYESGEFDLESLKAKLSATEKAMVEAHSKLTSKRKTLAKDLSRLVEKELGLLSMKRAKFSVDISESPANPLGADKVEFLLAANPGEGFKALSKVASGGELSRVMLILKAVLNERFGALTQVFDEIDSGVSGAVAQVVGEKLRDVAKNAQVILVTHSPQIAALADQHLYLAKNVESDRAQVSIQNLDKAQRIEQIARMLAGKNISKQFHESAKELLKQA